ncbi:hypothetical protein TNCV_2220621 [Trichonephila clavipes]|nr:hypothetical protein TNCV_2220621 [Trichonephila clavipes]
MVYCDSITSLTDLKEILKRHVRNILFFVLLYTVENAVLRFRIAADNTGQYIGAIHKNPPLSLKREEGHRRKTGKRNTTSFLEGE